MKRLLTAAVFLPLFIGIVGWAPPGAWAALVGVAAVLGVWEVGALAVGYGFRIHRLTSALLAAGACIAFLRPAGAAGWILMLSTAALGWTLLRVLWERPGPSSLSTVAGTLFAGFYPGVLAAFLVGLRAAGGEAGRGAVFFLFAVIWISDTFAYYGGRMVGRRSLAPSISPNKTVEGAVAGLLGAALAAVVSRQVIFPEIGSLAVPVGVALGLLGVVGDLVESALKRGAGVKDTAALLPGHGGMLDRLDSLMLATPAFYYYYQLAMR